MNIRIETVPSGIAVIRPEGSLDRDAAPAFQERLHALIHAGQDRLVVDLSAVDSIDFKGVAALISGLNAVRKNGGDLRIAQPNDSVKPLLELASLEWVLQAFESPDSAFP